MRPERASQEAGATVQAMEAYRGLLREWLLGLRGSGPRGHHDCYLRVIGGGGAGTSARRVDNSRVCSSACTGRTPEPSRGCHASQHPIHWRVANRGERTRALLALLPVVVVVVDNLRNTK